MLLFKLTSKRPFIVSHARGNLCFLVYTLSLVIVITFSDCNSRNNPPDLQQEKLQQFDIDTVLINDLLIRANTFNQTSPDSLCHYSLQALTRAKVISFKEGIARATSLQAYCNRRNGNFSEAVSLYLASINMFDSLKLMPERIDAQLLLANVYKEMGGEKGTAGVLQKGLSLAVQSQREAEMEKYTSGVVASLSMQGIILRDMWKQDRSTHLFDSAFLKYQQALKLVETTGIATDQLGKLYNNISQVYNERDSDYGKALFYLQKAVAFNSERNNLNSLSFNYGNISAVYQNMGNEQLAQEYAFKLLTVCVASKSPHRILNAYLTLYKLNKRFMRNDSALYYHELYVDISDSITNVQKAGQIAEMQTKYETTKKELEIERLSKSDKINKRRIALAAGAALLLFLLLSVGVWLYRRLRNQKNQINEQSNRLQWMMKELHHRVKNNLQIVSSLLNLQSYRLTDSESISAFKESQLRVQAMSLIHQRLYQSNDVSLVNFKLYVTDLVETLMKAYGFKADGFDLDLNIERELLDVDTVLPMGLMVNEIITNSFKYAFAEVERPLLSIRLKDDGRQLQLDIADNGKGMEIINDQFKSKGFGKSLIDALTKQLKATCSISGEDGTAYRFLIPYTKQKAA